MPTAELFALPVRPAPIWRTLDFFRLPTRSSRDTARRSSPHCAPMATKCDGRQRRPAIWDLAVSLPRADGSVGLHTFTGLSVSAGDVGKVALDLLATSPRLVMSIDADGDGIFEKSVDAAAEEILEASGPALLSATVIGPETLSGADAFGRAVALLFDRELRPDEADLTSSYEVDAHDVLSARTQLSGRLVFLFLGQPAGDLVARDLTVSGLFDSTGRAMLSQTMGLGSRIVPPDAVGGVVSGRVLDAEGAPIEGARGDLPEQLGRRDLRARAPVHRSRWHVSIRLGTPRGQGTFHHSSVGSSHGRVPGALDESSQSW